jgi:pimeloyl-ACP methyl ester carboxylesterase
VKTEAVLRGERCAESGPYALDPNDQAAYLQPMLMDGNAGFIAMAVAKQLKTRGAASMAAALSGLASAAVSCEVIWGASDAWFGESPDAAAVAAINASVVKVPGAGHFAPEDWAEKVTKALLGQKVE